MRRASAMKEEAVAEPSRATGLRTLGPAPSTIGALPLRTTSAKDTADEAHEKRPPSEEQGLKRNQSGVSSPPAREKAAALGLMGRASDQRKSSRRGEEGEEEAAPWRRGLGSQRRNHRCTGVVGKGVVGSHHDTRRRNWRWYVCQLMITHLCLACCVMIPGFNLEQYSYKVATLF
jgi:hypothetical protein